MPPPLPAKDQRRTTPIGLGVPVAPSFLNLDNEETLTYDARRTPAVSFPALLAEGLDAPEWGGAEAAITAPERRSARRSDPSLLSLSDADVEIVPTPKFEVVESNIHRIEAKQLTDHLSPIAASEPPSFYLRVGVSSYPPQSVPPALVRPRPSPKRSFFAKFLFVTILAVVLILVATEISIVRNLPWLDPRPFLSTLWKLVAQRIPWESLHKLPRF